VIGGTSLFGGRGRVYHAILGALVVGSVQNGLDLLGEPAAVKNIATGVVLVVAVVIDAVGRRRPMARGDPE
jgi:D-xylose transport system permease protein